MKKNSESGSVIARTIDRVAAQTAPATARRLHERLAMRVAHYADHPEQIADRLQELDREWDIERILSLNSSALSLLGLWRGIIRGKRRWLLLPFAVQGFFLQHAIQGWCPPLSLLRNMGVRTQQEIEQERYALKFLRGDFASSGKSDSEDKDTRALKAVRAS